MQASVQGPLFPQARTTTAPERGRHPAGQHPAARPPLQAAAGGRRPRGSAQAAHAASASEVTDGQVEAHQWVGRSARLARPDESGAHPPGVYSELSITPAEPGTATAISTLQQSSPQRRQRSPSVPAALGAAAAPPRQRGRPPGCRLGWHCRCPPHRWRSHEPLLQPW